jgi:hypothetical protein
MPRLTTASQARLVEAVLAAAAGEVKADHRLRIASFGR